MEFPFQVREIQGCDIQLVHSEGAFDDRAGQAARNVSVGRGFVVYVQAHVQRLGIAVFDDQGQVVFGDVLGKVDRAAQGQSLRIDGSRELASREIEFCHAAGVDVAFQIDLIDREMPARCFGFDGAVIDCDVANELFVALEPRDLECFILFGLVLFSRIVLVQQLLYVLQLHVFIEYQMDIGLVDGQVRYGRRADTAPDYVPWIYPEGAVWDVDHEVTVFVFPFKFFEGDLAQGGSTEPFHRDCARE